ncbi:MAG: beta-lactamase family protein [Defluviitaleaceae bacterium]|nr:beta-lactamase family protein [Defluviitaleaceae bacterium]
MGGVNFTFLSQLDDYIKMKQYRLVNAVVVYENDEIVFKRYYNNFSDDSVNHLCSTWKSILSLTLGICLDKGIVKDIDEPISRYLPQFAQGIDPRHRLITIRHLLTMSSGIHFIGGVHYHCPMLEQMRRTKDWIAHIADVQMTATPGTRFVYKEWDVILLSALIGKACGGLAYSVVWEHLYKPLGIAGVEWLAQNKGSLNYNADLDNGLPEDGGDKMTALNMAKIGRLMLNGGMWDGERIVSESYIKESIMPSKASAEYGLLWWLSDKGYHARGFGGQEINVYPDKNIVAVVQATVTPSSKFYSDICENIITTSEAFPHRVS